MTDFDTRINYEKRRYEITIYTDNNAHYDLAETFCRALTQVTREMERQKALTQVTERNGKVEGKETDWADWAIQNFIRREDE